ncbi:probable imidazolonepropionase [Centruroides vittatus]|uniref:probable imidazolonepropionase n=1 Tax=Centruroides vittatus TaxID=120091 RepID=UPI0035107961
MAKNLSKKLLIHSAEQVVQVVNNRQLVVKGNEMNNLITLEGGISVVVDEDGKIEDIGKDEVIAAKYKGAKFDEKLDASGKCLIPGLIDAHTHPIWAGDRVHEFEMKLRGATYMEIHKAGGGIQFTVDETRKASDEILLDLFKQRIFRMMQNGTTLVEVKSGYGLDCESEMRLLRIIEKARDAIPIELSSTFCGAHSVPKSKTAEEATRSVIDNQIPKLKQLMDEGELHVDSIDVFCEKGVFDLQQSRKILQKGRSIGLRLNFHGDELNSMGAAEMGASIGAHAISHLEEISDEGVKAMALSDTTAIILPTTAYILKLKPPPVRKMIGGGVAVALGTDFNPNAYCLSMPLIMNLACINLNMTLKEALVAATINSAYALGRSHTNGSIEIGKLADILILRHHRWEHLIYQIGEHNNLIMYVIKRGKIVYKNL